MTFILDADDDKRIIAVGDIHGMNQSLRSALRSPTFPTWLIPSCSALLAEISYDPQSDTLIHLGDIVSKKKKVSSDPVLDFMSTNSILGVRGNNDQTVIEWRAWMDWIVTLPGGQAWLEEMDSNWSHLDEANPEFNAWLKESHRQWEAHVPSGWELLGKHYKVARDMSQAHYDYLCSLPLVLHAPAVHTYFVHAGLLPADPTRTLDDPKQPLSHLPTTANPEEDELVLRSLQEIALLNEIPQNQDPWVVLNMRSLLEDGKVVEKPKKGTPWTEMWNDVMSDCSGLSEGTPSSLHCFPSTVLYGHAAARDLDVKRWSIGLDTGCVSDPILLHAQFVEVELRQAYGRRLTAVVLDAKSLSPQTHSEIIDPSLRDSYIPYGDEGTARIISVKCHK